MRQSPRRLRKNKRAGPSGRARVSKRTRAAFQHIRRRTVSCRRTGERPGLAPAAAFLLILRLSCAFCNIFFASVQSGKSHYEPFSRKNQVFFCRTHLPFLRNFPLFTLILPLYPKITASVGPRFSPLGVRDNFLQKFYQILWKRENSWQFLESQKTRFFRRFSSAPSCYFHSPVVKSTCYKIGVSFSYLC